MAGSWFTGSTTSSTTTVDTLATIEALTPAVGDTAIPTDSAYVLHCEAAGVWSYRFPGVGFNVTKPAAAASWGWYNQGSATKADSGGTVVLSNVAEGNSGPRSLTLAVPSDPTVTPYTVEIGVWVPWTTGSASTGNIVIGFTDGTGHAGIYLGEVNIDINRFTSATSFAGTDLSATGSTGQTILIKLTEDGTNRMWSIGTPGGDWMDLESPGYGRTVTITATHIMIGVLGHDVEIGNKVVVFHYATG